MGETIVFTSGKGGVGKTTTIANIGVGLSQLDKKVIMLDTDMGLRNLDVVMGLETQVNYNLLDLLDSKCKLQQALIRDKRFPNLYMIPASLKLLSMEQYKHKFQRLLDHLKQEFDYCLIDCPAGIDQCFYFAISVADRAIILTTPQISAVKDASRVIQILNGTNIKRLEVIINEYDEKMVRKHYVLSKEDIQDLFDVPVLGTIPYDYKVTISQNNGVPVMTMRSKATKSFLFLSQKLVSNELFEREVVL